MSDTHFTVSVFIVLMLIASVVAVATKWIRVPYTLALVLVGLLISPLQFLPAVHISPDLMLLIFLPALLFEAAWNLDIDRLRSNLFPILALAVPGVCVAAGVIGVLLHFMIGMAWPGALLFGAMASATDPVSVLALFKDFGLPKRLSVLIEAESLFNDGTAVVVFRIILAVALGSTVGGSTAVLWGSLREFGFVVFGGLAVGAMVGMACSIVTSYINDHLLEITLTTIVAYGSFLLAESLGVSPVIAVLVAGLVVGNYGRRTGMSPTTQIAVTSFWEYAAFVANSLVFLLIGLEVQVGVLAQDSGRILWAFIATVVSRVVVVYGFMGLANWMGARVPFRWQHVQIWGGLRGALSIALVLSLPVTVADRHHLSAMIFGTVILSLLSQGLTLSRLLQWLHFEAPGAESQAYEMTRGELIATAAALGELEGLNSQGIVLPNVYDGLRKWATDNRDQLTARIAELPHVDPEFEREQMVRFRRYLIDVQKARLSTLLRDGLLSETAYRTLSEKLNEESEKPTV